MKKSFFLFSSIAVSLLLILISCTKESVISTNPYKYQTTANFADTPYLDNNNPADDTPYIKTIPVFEPPVDTPYLQNNHTLKNR